MRKKSDDADDYIHAEEATEHMKFFYSKSEKNFFKRAEMKRISEDDYIREEEREKAESEKAELLQQSESEKTKILQEADFRIQEEREKADIREDQARKEERERANARIDQVRKEEQKKAESEKAELLEKIRKLESLIVLEESEDGT